METAIVSVICIALIVVGGMTMSQSFLSSVDSTALGLEEVGERDEEITRTSLSMLSANTDDSGTTLNLTLENSGQTKLNDFAKWDIIIHYYDGDDNYYVVWLPYTETTPGDNEWTKEGIYFDADSQEAEVFEPGILNPGEELAIEAKLSPPVGEDTTNMAIVAAPNGISASKSFIAND